MVWKDCVVCFFATISKSWAGEEYLGGGVKKSPKPCEHFRELYTHPLTLKYFIFLGFTLSLQKD